MSPGDSDERSLAGEQLRAAVKEALFGTREQDAFRIGRFLVGKKLGEGGMGAVYAAYDEELGRRVAIKVLRSATGGGSDGHARLLREAQAMVS